VFTWIPAFADFIRSTLATTPTPAPSAQPVSNTVTGAATRSPSCRRATTHLAAVRRIEQTLLRRLQAARRHPAGQDGRRVLQRASRRYRDARARRLRAASAMRQACGSTA
jgi:hypothetical protein